MDFKELWNHRGIIIIILLFIAANMLFLNFYSDVWWDSSVYIGMGKHIFSSGNSGLWEESRPLLFPFLLGIGWKMGFDAVIFGRIISLVFAGLALFMIYLIGSRLFSRKAGLIGAFFLGFSFTFFFFSSNILTEIPSVFFMLLAFYFFIDNRFFLMGLFSGIAVITRFFQVFIISGMILAFLFYFSRKNDFSRKLFYLALGFLIPVIPVILLNYHLYGDILTPIKVQMHLSRTTGLANYHEYRFYPAGLLKENFMLVFLIAIPFFFRKDYRFYALLLAPLIHLAVFSVVRQKEMRYALLAVPFLCLLLAYCLWQIYDRIKNKQIAVEIFSVMAILFLLTGFISLKGSLSYQQNNEELRHFQDYIKDAKGRIWITNPIYALYSDSRIDGLLYYKSGPNLIKFLGENGADIVLFNDCDIECPPAELDKECLESRKELSKELSRMKIAYEKKSDSCTHQIFTS